MPLLAADIGGTKTLSALVDGDRAVDVRNFPTERGGGPEQWLMNIDRAAADWRGRYDGAAFAVTGHVSGGSWSALNAKTLDIAGSYPLAERVRAIFGCAPVLANDAQAAAYGEFLYGAGQGGDIVFLTVSTGVGGGIVMNGRLVAGASGLAGHFGQICGAGGGKLEDTVSGGAMERQARALGHALRMPAIFRQAEDGARWAGDILDASVRGVAALCADIRLTLDPERIVIGGSVGLAPGYLDRVSSCLKGLPKRLRPELRPAALGANAGILGVAALFYAET